jgi:hypothetical protein
MKFHEEKNEWVKKRLIKQRARIRTAVIKAYLANNGTYPPHTGLKRLQIIY